MSGGGLRGRPVGKGLTLCSPLEAGGPGCSSPEGRQGALAARRRRVGSPCEAPRGTGGVGAAPVRPPPRAPARSCRLSVFHPSGTIISCDLELTFKPI